MGNTLCKPVPEQFVEPTKNIEPLLTEEAIKILNIETDKKNEIVETILDPVISETKEPVISEPVISAATVISETIISVNEIKKTIEPVISETIEPVISETVIDTLEAREEPLSLIQPPDESSSTSFNDEVPEPPKKKRGRKKKTDQ
jgi:hypothetical protein